MQFVPKEQLKIARRFNAGLNRQSSQVPQGRLKRIERKQGKRFQPSGRDLKTVTRPTVETPAYSRMSFGTQIC
jgi:hypothetical protein